MNATPTLWGRPAWWDDARCRDLDACGGDRDLFFPRGTEGGGTIPGLGAQIARARAVCEACPVRFSDCLPWALRAGSGGGPVKHGVWAGYTPEELQEIARERRVGVPA